MLPTKQDSTSGEPSFARLWEFDDLLTMPSIESLPTYVPTLVPWNTSLTWQLRLKFFLTGVLFPMICLTVIGAGYGSGSLEAPWQSGRLVHYIAVLTGRPTIFVFWPLLFFSFFCLSRWCFNPLKHNSFWIQIGLVTGVIQSMVFSILLFFMSGPVSQIMALFIGPLLALIVFLIDLAIRKKLVTRRFSIKYLIGLTTLVSASLALIMAAGVTPVAIAQGALGYLFVGLLLIIGSATTLGFITFCRVCFASFFIAKQNGRSSGLIPQILGWLAWLGAYGSTWKAALDLMMIEYLKLPTTDPNCSVSSAAANGHPELVGSFELDPTQTGKVTGKINRQMQRLKFLEFALATSLPSMHCLIRRIYNRFGPAVALVCRANIWFSDLTFLFLKPLEWIAIGIQVSLGVNSRSVERIYTQPNRKRSA